MRTSKNIAVRITAMLLFFAIISAVILYDAGAYDISFIKRPAVYTETESDTLPPDTTVPSTTLPDTDNSGSTDGTDSSGNTTTAPSPPVNNTDPDKILNQINSLDKALSSGYSYSYQKFGDKHALAYNSFGFLSGGFSLSEEKVTKTVVYSMDNGRYATKTVTTNEKIPRIRLYYGYMIVNQGKTNTIYGREGQKLADGFAGTLIYQTSFDGMPVVKENNKYYKLDGAKGLVEISENEINYLAIAFDAPKYYANSNIDLYPFSTIVEELVQIGVVTTEPPTTTPDTTVPDTTEPGTSVSGTSVSDTSAPDTTVPDTTVPSTAAPDTSESETQTDTSVSETSVPTRAREVSASGSIASDTESAGTTEPDTTLPESASPDTTAPDTSATDTTAPETTSPETTAPAETLPNGVRPEGTIVEKDGIIYRVEHRVRYGYKNKAGKVVIAPKYMKAYGFTSEGRAAVITTDGYFIFINTSGQEAVSLISSPYVWPAELNYKKHFHAYYTGLNNDVSDLGMYYFDEGYVMLRYCIKDTRNANKVYLDTRRLYDVNGNRHIVPGNYNLENYSEGIMVISKDGKFGYMTTDDSWVCLPEFDEARPFIQGLAVAHTKDGYGMIDKNGNTVLPFVFDYISDVSYGKVAAYSSKLGWKIYTVVVK